MKRSPAVITPIIWHQARRHEQERFAGRHRERWYTAVAAFSLVLLTAAVLLIVNLGVEHATALGR